MMERQVMDAEMIVRKISNGYGFLLKYGLRETWKRLRCGATYDLHGVTKLYLATHETNCINCRSKIPTFNALRIRHCLNVAKSIHIFLTQVWGGGADMYLHYRVARLERKTVALVVKPFAFGVGLLVEVWRDGSLIGERIVPSLEALDSLQGKSCTIIVNSIVQWHLAYGDGIISNKALKKTVDGILKLKDTLCAPLIFLVHDYYCICPRVTLSDTNGRYCLSEISLKDCEICLKRKSGGLVIANDLTIEEWRKDFKSLLGSCYEVRTFSEDTCKRIAAVYKGLKLTIVPHSLICKFRKRPRISQSGIVIGVLGGISKQKGALEILALGRYLQRIDKRDVRIVIVGNLAAAVDGNIPSNIVILGSYAVENLPEIIEREGINIGFMPSVWPETFSYVTHELIALGLPVVCFDIGAQADAVKKYDKGEVVKIMAPEAVWIAIEQLYEKSRH